MKHGSDKQTPAPSTPRGEAPAGGHGQRAIAGPDAGRSASRELAGRRYGTGATLQAPPGSPNGPSAPPAPRSATSSLQVACGRLHAQHGDRLQTGSEQVGVPTAAAAAVILAESQFSPAPVDDRMPIRFEPYAFFQQTGRWLVATHKDQAAEYRAFGEAQTIDPAAAHTSVRMGVAQISGSEAGAAGFESAESMLHAMQTDPAAQVAGLFQVIAADDGLRTALAEQDWRQVASLRAGPGFGALGFDEALAASAEAWRKVEAGGGDDDTDSPKKPKVKRKRADA